MPNAPQPTAQGPIDDSPVTLSTLFASLVKPNWPFLAGTKIPVEDLGACARRGTPEQRQTSIEVRAVLERLWQLDADDSLRRELEEGYYQPCVCFEDPPEEPIGEVQSAGPPLPAELVIKVLHFALPDVIGSVTAVEVTRFGRLRIANKAFKGLVEDLFPHTLSRYTSAVVRDLLHVSRWKSIRSLSQHAAASAPLFALAPNLEVWYRRTEHRKLNSLLPYFKALEHLTIYAVALALDLRAIDLSQCRRLRHVHIDVEPASGGCTQAQRPVDQHGPASSRASPETLPPPRLSSVTVGSVDGLHGSPLYVASNHLMLDSLHHLIHPGLDVLQLSGILLDRTSLVRLGLARRCGPSTLRLRRCELDDAGVEALALGQKQDLSFLSLRNNIINHSHVFALDANTSVTTLEASYNRLQSASLGLDHNQHLRQLDLSGCFAHFEHDEPRMAGILRDLADQLARNTALELLVLSDNGIRDEVAPQLSMRRNQTLQGLYLDRNELSVVGLRAILAGNSTLRRVDVRGNLMTEDCRRELAGEGELEIWLWDGEER